MAEVNLDMLDSHFDSGAEVSTTTLVEKKIAKDLRGGVKILGRGEITKKLTLTVNAVSASAREKIEAAGGSVNIVAVPASRAVKNRTKRTAKEG